MSAPLLCSRYPGPCYAPCRLQTPQLQGSDYTAVQGQTITLAAGQKEAKVTVGIVDDSEKESDEVIGIKVSVASGKIVAAGDLTIQNDDADFFEFSQVVYIEQSAGEIERQPYRTLAKMGFRDSFLAAYASGSATIKLAGDLGSPTPFVAFKGANLTVAEPGSRPDRLEFTIVGTNVADGTTDAVTVSLTFRPVNSNEPVFQLPGGKPVETIELPEEQDAKTAVTRVHATDADFAQTCTYALVSQDRNGAPPASAAETFAVDSRTGVVTAGASYDFETASPLVTQTLTIRATATDGSTSDMKLIVKLVTVQPQRQPEHPTAKDGSVWSSRKLLQNNQHRLTNDEGNDWISRKIQSGKPFVAGRFGSAESCLVLQFLQNRDPIRPCADPHSSSGIYPETNNLFQSFSSLYWEALNQLDEGDAMGSMGHIQPFENKLFPRMSMGVVMTGRALEPFYFRNPWSRHLGGKTVLVVHGFTESIKCQLRRSKGLFANPLILPPDIVWKHVTMPQCLGRHTPHSSWHETFSAVKKMIDASGRFDIAIVAAGSYAMPLAMHCKTHLHSSAIVMGGGSQLLFGLKGRRWDTHPILSRLYNSNWMYPLKSETPSNANTVEDGGPYWGAPNQQESKCPVRHS